MASMAGEKADIEDIIKHNKDVNILVLKINELIFDNIATSIFKL